MFWVVISFFKGDAVDDAPAFAIPRYGPSVKALKCGWQGGMATLNPFDYLAVMFFPEAKAGSPTQLTFDKLAESIVDWVTRIARGIHEYNQAFPINIGGTELASQASTLTKTVPGTNLPRLLEGWVFWQEHYTGGWVILY